jgi:hypothetical protein
MEQYQHDLDRERAHHHFQLSQSQQEVEKLKEMLATFDDTLKKKDHIIANLTAAVGKEVCARFTICHTHVLSWSYRSSAPIHACTRALSFHSALHSWS